jgi:hypothetical protein
MASKTTVVMTDDLDGSAEGDVRTYGFSFDGHDYQIDLASVNADRLREAFRPFAEAGRKAGRPSRKPARDRDQSGAVRAWAREHGHKVSDRGRIPAAIVAEYQAANGHAA